MSVPRIAISLGDPCGVGPEITLRALVDERLRGVLQPTLYGDEGVWTRTKELCGLDVDVTLVAVSDLGHDGAPWGGRTDGSSRAQLAYIEAAVDALGRGQSDALCTAPVTKAAICAAGFQFSGHTEFLEDRLGVSDVVMMLAGPRLRVSLVTTHVPLREVPELVTEERVYKTVRRTEEALRRWFGIECPHIAVCGLNPHAGEEGQFGDEEARSIEPALARLRAEGLEVEGPLSGDAAMAQGAAGRFDAVVAMYHDQGLGPIKSVHPHQAVNMTLGLPFVRTSPDHGSALDIAGKGIASPEGMIAALQLAARLAERR